MASVENRISISDSRVLDLISNGDPDWLRTLRHQAWTTFQDLPMPSTKDEDWRRLDLRGFRWENYQIPSQPTYPPLTDLTDLLEPIRKALSPLSRESVDALLVVHSGRMVFRYLSDDGRRKGIIVDDVRGTTGDRDVHWQTYLHRLIPPSTSKFVAVHAALMNSGTVVCVPERTRLEKPIYLFHWLDEPGSALFDHLLLIARKDSESTLVVHHASPEDLSSGLHSGAVEIYAEPGARVNVVAFQHWSWSLYDFRFLRGRLEDNAYVRWCLANLGARISRIDVHSQLAGRGAATDMLSITVAEQNQHIEHHTNQEHIKDRCRSDLLFKVVLLDRASSVYRGMIRVHPKAQGTDAYQANRNLILSPGARADSMPLLEIQANEVRCTHGATIARLDELQLFYLMSRGLPRRLAEKIVVDGFLKPVVDRFPIPWLNEKIQMLWQRKIAGL